MSLTGTLTNPNDSKEYWLPTSILFERRLRNAWLSNTSQERTKIPRPVWHTMNDNWECQ